MICMTEDSLSKGICLVLPGPRLRLHYTDLQSFFTPCKDLAICLKGDAVPVNVTTPTAGTALGCWWTTYLYRPY